MFCIHLEDFPLIHKEFYHAIDSLVKSLLQAILVTRVKQFLPCCVLMIPNYATTSAKAPRCCTINLSNDNRSIDGNSEKGKVILKRGREIASDMMRVL